MARPKGVIQKRDESKYWLPSGVTLKEGQTNYRKETKLTFIDSEFGEFVSYFKALQDANASTHTKAVIKRRSETNIARYGGNSPMASEQVRNNQKQVIFDKYGVKNPSESQLVKDKKKKTSLKNWGTDNPMQSPKVKLKHKESVEVKYGVSNIMHHPDIKLKMRKIMIDNGIAEILPNGLTMEQTFKALNLPFLSNAFKLRNEFGPEFALKWLENRKERISSLELLFKEIYPDAERCQKVPPGLQYYRPDFKIKNIYVDVDGLLYHSEEYKERQAHVKKAKLFKEAGYTLLQFRQNEILDQEEIVKSIINAKIGIISNKYFARKLEIKEISLKDANEFFERTHLMGKHPTSKAVGLFNNEQLVCCISYKKYKEGLDISRFSCELNTIVVGGLSRLLSYIKNKENPKFIQSFVDLRYGSGNSLLKIGFKLENITVGWKWTDFYQTYNRLQCYGNMDERMLSEREYAEEKGWVKIYDAGQARFVISF